ncbi:probable coiled-coil domain-containing protein 13 at N-terminal half [Coccomyxa sp. Obi]|nr:probable coiled-coil domain-containing protein 13 at N-terminal half [Coccomyxa sp. Obi]
MSETIDTPRGAGGGISPEVRHYKRTISDLLPDKYEFSADPHLNIASSLPSDNRLSGTEEQFTNEGDGVHSEVDIHVGPAEDNDSLTVVQLKPADEDSVYVDVSHARIEADHPVDINSPAHEDVSTSLSAPAEVDHEPHSFEEEAQQKYPGSLSNSETNEEPMQAMAPRMPTEPEPGTIIGVDTAFESEEDAAHRMLLQAVADLQAENASLTEALSVQSQELQSLREAAKHSAAQQAAPAQSELKDDKGDEGEQSADAVQEAGAPVEVARADAVPKDRTEALYRSLELKVQQLKLERDAMERALRREVGDDTPLTKLLDADSDWRGRAQTIALLKEKLLSLHETHAQAMGNPSSARNRHDVNNRANLERLRGERAREAEELRAELASMRAALEDALQKQQGAAARKKALEKEVRSLKQKVVLLLDKSATDDSLIAALRSPAARLGAFASSAAVPNQALHPAGGSFSADAGALTGPAVTWEAPERGGSRVSVVVPGGPVPEQAPAGEHLPTSAAESAPVQRTSFSISLDINTNTVSIQGSVTSPNQADRTAKCATTALSMKPDSVLGSPAQPIIAEQEGALGDGDTQEGEDVGPEQSADIEEGWENLAEEDQCPEEVVESWEEADTAEAAAEYEDPKQYEVSGEATAPLEDEEPATECVAENKMDSANTAQPADQPAPDSDTDFEERDAEHSTQVSVIKSSRPAEGNFTISASGKRIAARSNALDVVGTASEGAEALVEGHEKRRKGIDAVHKAVEDALAEAQHAVTEDS